MARVVNRTSVSGNRGHLYRYSDASTANTALTLSTEDSKRLRILYVTVKYSANVSVDVTITLNSGVGTAYDTLIQTISMVSQRDAFWIPDQDFILSPRGVMDDGQTQGSGDALDLLAPAGGSGITAALTIYVEVV